MKKFKIILIGDVCIDEYRYGTVDRISPEAPVPVFKHSHTTYKDGMAANVKNNLESLGIEVVSLFGESSIKSRLIDIRSNQQIVRIDNDVLSTPITPKTWKTLFSETDSCDAIVISDYNKGFIPIDVIGYIIESARSVSIPVFVDTKKTDLHVFDGCYVKINNFELSQARTRCDNLIVTNGSDGATYKGVRYFTEPVDVVDVCGAGDTFLSAMTYEYLHSDDIESAIRFANVAAGITVQHSGVYSPSIEEINKAMT